MNRIDAGTRQAARSQLAAVLTLLAAAAVAVPNATALPREKDRWIELKTPHFQVFSNSGPRRTEELARNLEQLRAVLGQLSSGEVNSPVPTYVYVFGNDKKFTPYKPLYQGRPADLAGYFLNPKHGNYIAINGDPAIDPAETVYHELVHYFLANNHPGLPLWFNEGFAELYSTFELVEERARIGHPIVRHIFWLRRNPLIPLDQLFAIDNDSPEYHEGSRKGVFYAQSWALVHYLLIGNDTRESQVGRYLELLTAGVERDSAFTEAFATEYAQLEKELRAYVEGTRMRYYWADVEPLATGSFQVRDLSYPEVLTRLGDLSTVLEGRDEEARRHFEAALERRGDDALALSGLGFLAQQRDRDDEALSFLERAVEAGGDDFLIHYRYAESLLKARSEQAASRERARRSLRRSIDRNGEYAPAWALLAYAMSFEDAPSEEARRIAEAAHRRLPSREDVAHVLMVIYARRGDHDAARRLFDRFFAAKASAEARAKARSVLVTMDFNRAQQLLADQRHEEALALLEALAERAVGTSEHARVEATLGELRATQAENRFIDRYNEAVRSLNDGDEASAVAILEQLAAAASPTQAQRARELLARAEERIARRALQDRMHRVNELLAQGRGEEALRALEQIEAPPGSWERQWIEETRAELRESLDRHRVAERFNDAVRSFDAGDFQATVRILEALLPRLAKGSRRYAEARKLLADAKAELRLRDGRRY